MTGPADPGTGRPCQRRGAALRSARGREERDPGVPDHPAGQAHAGPGGPAHVRRAPTCAGPSPRGSCAARRRQRRLLHAARARQPGRRLRDRARGSRPRAAARRCRASPPLRPRARGADSVSRASPSGAAARAAERAAGARCDDRGAGVRAERAHRHPRRQRARPCPLLAALRQPAPAREHGALRLPRPAGARASTSTGTRSRATPSPSSAPRPDATRTTATSPTSSASCRPGASCSAPAGRRTTSAITTPAASASTTPSSASSRSRTRMLELSGDSGLMMFAYTAEAGSKSEEALSLLASWTATARACKRHRRSLMQITRNSVETMAGPSDWFTGAVYIDAVAAPSDTSRLSASSVHFTPGARTAWHTHPNGQTIFVTRGRRPRAAPRRPDRGDPPRRPRLLRAGRGALARRRADAVHDPPRDGRGRRRGQRRDLGRPRHRRGVRRGARVVLSGSAGRAGTVDVTVTTLNGTSAGSRDQFTYG